MLRAFLKQVEMKGVGRGCTRMGYHYTRTKILRTPLLGGHGDLVSRLLMGITGVTIIALNPQP